MSRGPTLTDPEKQAIAEYATHSNVASVAELSRATGRSARSVRRVLVESGIDPVEFFGERRATRIELVERIATKALQRLEERLDAGDKIPPAQLAVVAGIRCDKASKLTHERDALLELNRRRRRSLWSEAVAALELLHRDPSEAA
jgi:hypothetical protein